MAHKKRLEAQLDYAKAQEAAEVVPNRGGAAGSGDADPLPKPSMSCVYACPMGAYGLLLQCKGVSETLAHGEETNAPGSEADDLEFQDGHVDDDEFDASSFEPSYSSPGPPCGTGVERDRVPAMPTATCRPQPHREKIPTLQAPFNVAVARPVAKKEMYANPEALKAVRSE